MTSRNAESGQTSLRISRRPELFSVILAVAIAALIFSSSVRGQERSRQTAKSAVLDGPGLLPFDASESLGVFVGVEKFPEDVTIQDAHYAVDDAIDLAHLFVFDLKLIPSSRVRLALSGSPKKSVSRARLDELLGRGAQLSGAKHQTLQDLGATITNEGGARGLLLVSISSHGFDSAGKHLVLAQDSRMDEVQCSAVSVDSFLKAVSLSESQRGLILLDTCRQELTSEYGHADFVDFSSALEKALSLNSGLTTLAAARPGGIAYAEEGNGIFTKAIVDGLRCKAPKDSNGLVTVQALANFVETSIDDYVRNRSSERGRQARGIVRTFWKQGAELLPLVDCSKDSSN